jgi:diketogulonate reductase-like aldo/keto reductase
MDLKSLGKTQVKLPEIGFGTWRYSGGVEPLQAAIDHGAYLVDTAEAYGTEEVVGKAIHGRRDQVFLATKALPRHFRRLDLIAAAEQSLRRLGTDYIDLYQLHWPNYAVPIAETMAAMEELVQAGKIRFIGVSNFSVSELRKAQAALTKNRIVSNQVRYGLLDRTIEGGLLKFCQQSEVTIIAFSPLGAAFSNFRAHDPEGALGQIASKTGKTEAQVALNWVISQENVVAIPKASSVQHAIDDCGASGWRLSPQDYQFLAAKISCRRRGRLESAVKRLARHALQRFAKRNL